MGCGGPSVGGRGRSVPSWRVIRLDAATVLLQWATGGLAFLWVTTRRRQVGLGYGWLLRGSYLGLALGALACRLAVDVVPVRDVASLGGAVATAVPLAVSSARRKAGVSGQQEEHDRRTARVAAMTGIERTGSASARGTGAGATPGGTGTTVAREFPPALDLVAPIIGAIGLIAAGWVAAGGGVGTRLLAVARTLAGAAFLGAVTDAMLLGHWYLVQPGLPRRLLLELVRWTAYVWPLEVALLLIPTGMVSVLVGTIDDGWGGTLGWFW